MKKLKLHINRVKKIGGSLLLVGILCISGPFVITANAHILDTVSELITPEVSAEPVDVDVVRETVNMEQFGALTTDTIIAKTIKAAEISNEVTEIVNIKMYVITEEERELLARLVELEAGNQTLEERAKVVKVVFNRVDDGRFGEGIEGVIFARNQFEPAPKIPYTTPSEASYNAVDALVDGTIDLSYFECLYFWGDGQLNHFY